ncbi:RagB/SusD family nutrient uptake outer membrane protein [Reichenbachiella sp. MALMAid0571]|uniref:RagB/SusD family nutrient uptake outer membrane protein n=1 Tax=Reichenbachiella sp. MALMAid0571 TaxID=3143939 RepID=UPI0032DF37E0
MKYLKYISIVTFVLVIAACEDIFDRQPLDKISSSAVWSDQQLIDASLADLYANTPFFYSENSLMATQPAYMGAEAYVHDASSSWIQGTLNETGGVWDYWAYGHIRNLNDFIENVSQSPIDENVREVRLAEARFLRAFVYFEMVKRYGGVPIITIPQSINAPEDELYVHRDTEKEVYDFIASECDDIAQVLPEIADEYGRATKYTALALKSRAMLYAASIATYSTQQLDGLLGFPAAEATAYWQKSYDASKLIVDSELFELYEGKVDKAENFQYLFLEERNSEVIFAKVFNGKGQVGHSFDYYNYPGGFEKNWGGSTAAYLETVESFEYVDGTSGKLDYNFLENNPISFDELFENKDPRFFASILYPGATFKDGMIYCHGGTYVDGELITTTTLIGEYKGLPWYAVSPFQNRTYGRGFSIRKMINEPEEQALAGESDTDYIVFRYGEILLNLAEAAFELGKTDEAKDYLNEIRERAGIALLTSVDREKIRQERQVELTFEGHRFWDLRRWRIAEEELSKEMHSIKMNFDWDSKTYEVKIENADVVTRDFEARHYYLPITVGRISNNPNLAPDNTGY